MSAADWASVLRPARSPASLATSEPRAVRALLIAFALLFAGFFLVLPLATVFVSASAKGALAFVDALRDADALAAMKLTLLSPRSRCR